MNNYNPRHARRRPRHQLWGTHVAIALIVALVLSTIILTATAGAAQ